MSYYNLLIVNKSPEPACCALYFTLPHSHLFASALWAYTQVEPNGASDLFWSTDPQIILADRKDALLSPFQCLELKGMQTAALVRKNDGTYALEPKYMPEAQPPGHAVIANETGKALNIGLGAEGFGKAYALDVLSGTNVLLDFSPKIWLAIYKLPPPTPPPPGKLIHLGDEELWHDPKAIDSGDFAQSCELQAYAGFHGFIATLLPGLPAPLVEIVNLPL